jgi:hypothetical protein
LSDGEIVPTSGGVGEGHVEPHVRSKVLKGATACRD